MVPDKLGGHTRGAANAVPFELQHHVSGAPTGGPQLGHVLPKASKPQTDVRSALGR